MSVPFVYGPGVQSISLATVSPGENKIGAVTGWGLTSENGKMSTILQFVHVPIIGHEQCSEAYSILTKKMLCAGYAAGKGVCTSDSGGPLVVDGKLVGTVAFGTGCAHAGKPGVYANIPAFLDFIVSNTNL